MLVRVLSEQLPVLQGLLLWLLHIIIHFVYIILQFFLYLTAYFRKLVSNGKFYVKYEYILLRYMGCLK